jgi:hypothetical protein
MKNIRTILLAITLTCSAFNFYAITYYSKGSLDATDLNSWSVNPDGTGTSPGYFNSSLTIDEFIIQSGHSMTTSKAWSFGSSDKAFKLRIKDGGKLTATFDITLKLGNTFQIDNGGTYEHNVASNLSTLFTGTEVFETNSNFVILQCNASPVIPDNGYGNLTFKNSISANLGMNSKITRVKGNLSYEITCTGVTKFSMVTAATTVTVLDVDGDLIVNSPDGTGSIQISNGTGSSTLNVGGDVKIIKGVLSLASGTGTSILNIGKGLLITGGTINSTNSASPATINFNGINSLFSKTGGTYGNSANINIGVGTNANLTVDGALTVGTGRTLTLGGNVVVGQVTDTLSVGASTQDTLKIGGTVTGSGKIYAFFGTVLYNGTTRQTISNIKSYSSTNDTTYLRKLVVNNKEGVDLSAHLNIKSALNIFAGSKIYLGDWDLAVDPKAIRVNTDTTVLKNGLGSFYLKDVLVPNPVPNPITKLNKILTSKAKIKALGESVIIEGLEIGSSLAVYTIDGRVIKTIQVTVDNVSLNLNKGLYIIALNTKEGRFTEKIIVQ